MESTKKKILIFIPEFPGLTETFIEREVSKLAESEEIDIKVLSLLKGNGTLSPSSKGVTEYKKLTWRYSLLASLYFILKPIRLTQAFFTILKNKNRNIIQTVYLFLKSVGYTKIFEEYKPDIIYAHFMSESSTIALVSSIILNKPLVIAGHAKDVLQETGPTSENVELIEQKVRHAKHVFICNDNAHEKLIKKCGVKYPKNIHLKYHGIDEQWLKEKYKEAKKVDKPKETVIFTIGRFVEKKGFNYLLEAINILKEKKIDMHLFIAGAPGSCYEGIKDLIKVLELEEQVTILGEGKGISFDEILSYYEVSDIFTLPSVNVSKGDADGIPNVLIEAAYLKIPIVTTDAGSITDFIEDNKDGLVVSQRDEKELAKALEKLIKDKSLQKKFTTNAYEKAREMFNLEDNVKEIERLLLD